MRLLLFIFIFITISNAAGGGSQDFVCFGYGDGKNKVPGTKFYEEGKTSYESARWCEQGGGCYINCIDPRNNGITNNVELLSSGQTPKLKLKDGASTKNAAKFWCQVNSCYAPTGSLNGYNFSQYQQEAIVCKSCGTRWYVSRPGGTPIPDPDPDPKPELNDLIVEEHNLIGSLPSNIIYTRTTGSNIKLRIFHKDSSGGIGAGLDGAKCKVYYGSGVVLEQEAKYNFWSGGGAFIFENGSVLSKAGQYYVECTGYKSSKEVKGQKLPFYVAPASYSAEFKINANGQDYVINRKNGTSNGSTIKSSLDASFLPVVKVGEEIGLFLSGSANANSGSVDSGVNTSMQQKGQMQNVVEGLNASSGNRICKADAPKLPDKSSIKINSGNFNGKVTSIVFDDAYKGTITVSYNDQDMNNIIEQERARGGCSGNGTGNGKCPFPPTFEFTFKYLVVPNNFQLTLKNNANQDIKVLYYGQGSSPENEGTSKLKVIPLNSQNQPLKNFIDGCAAIDTDLELNGKDISIVFIDPNNPNSSSTSTTIYAKEFKSNTDNTAIADLNRVLSIKRADGSDWIPSMVAEPAFLGADVKPLMYFTGKKNDAAYPQYTPLFNALTNVVILRGRINAIDSDNADDYSKMPVSKVYYEFYCQTCDLNRVGQITGVQKYVGSTTSQGWWLDSTFGNHNSSRIATKNITTTGGLSVSNVSEFANGMQNISYQTAPAGKYEIKINQSLDATSFPLFLLYKPYYNQNATNGTSAFVTIYSLIKDENRDFGVDTGEGKNTRSGSRTGGF